MSAGPLGRVPWSGIGAGSHAVRGSVVGLLIARCIIGAAFSLSFNIHVRVPKGEREKVDYSCT